MLKTKDTLWTRSFISACLGNFLLFFAFYLLLPIFPLYLIDQFGASKSVVGVVLSVYTIAALLIRPIAAFVLDMYERRPIYLMAFAVFVLSFVGYPLSATLTLFLILRVAHGFTFGFVTTAANSFIVDILPPSRRGEGLGYFGVANNLAMAVGPMTGLLLHEGHDFNTIFYTAVVSGLIGFLFALSIKGSKVKKTRVDEPLTFDRFFLFQGIKAGLCLLLMGVAYGMLTTYVAIYGKELGILSGVGIFFSLMAIGMVVARLFAGRLVDRGKLVQVIAIGTLVCVISFIMLAALKGLDEYNHDLVVISFFVVALLLGIGYGMMFPAYNTLFVNLAPNNRRATASSTYMTSWDIGIGMGLILGGRLADSIGGLSSAYLTGGLCAIFSLVYFVKMAGPHFEMRKLR